MVQRRVAYIKRSLIRLHAMFIICTMLLITAGGTTVAAVPPNRPEVQDGNAPNKLSDI